jgi:hypothetical protein
VLLTRLPSCAPQREADEAADRVRLQAAQAQEEQCARQARCALRLPHATAPEGGSRTLARTLRVVPFRPARLPRFTKLNGAKIAAQWRLVMRASKVSSIREEAAALAEDTELGQLRSTARASQLRRDLSTAEAQHATAVRSHLAAVDALLELQSARVSGLRDAFEARSSAALAFLAAERAAAEATHASRRAALLADIADIRARAAAAEAADAAAYAAEETRILEATMEEMQVIKLSGESALADMEARLVAADRAHTEATSDTVVAVEELCRAEAASAQVVATRTRELARLTEATAALRATSEEGAREWEERVSTLRAEKDSIFARHKELKKDMDRSRGADAALLRDAVVQSAARAKALSEVLAKAQRVMRMAELNVNVDAAQRAALAAAGVVDEPGVALSDKALRERARLRAEEARAAEATHAVAQASGAVAPELNLGLSVTGTAVRTSAPPGAASRPGTSSLGGTQRSSAAGAGPRPGGTASGARPAATRPASTTR